MDMSAADDPITLDDLLAPPSPHLRLSSPSSSTSTRPPSTAPVEAVSLNLARLHVKTAHAAPTDVPKDGHIVLSFPARPPTDSAHQDMAGPLADLPDSASPIRGHSYRTSSHGPPPSQGHTSLGLLDSSDLGAWPEIRSAREHHDQEVQTTEVDATDGAEMALYKARVCSHSNPSGNIYHTPENGW